MGAWAYDSDANDDVYDALECFDFQERMELRVGDASVRFELADDISTLWRRTGCRRCTSTRGWWCS